VPLDERPDLQKLDPVVLADDFAGKIIRQTRLTARALLGPIVDADSDDDAHLFRTIDAHAFR